MKAVRTDTKGDKGRADAARRGGRACEVNFVVETTSRAASAPLWCRTGSARPIELVEVLASVIVVLRSWRSIRWATFSWFSLVAVNIFILVVANTSMEMLVDPDSMFCAECATQGRCVHRGLPIVLTAALQVN